MIISEQFLYSMSTNKWREATGVFSDKKIPQKVKEKFHKIVLRPAMMYGSEIRGEKRKWK